MDVKEAVRVAKAYTFDLFAEESIKNIGLEEVEERGGIWRITIGFSRPWDSNIGNVLGGASGRTYKIILVNDKNGRILSVKDRDISKLL